MYLAMIDEKYKNYLYDLGSILREMGVEAVEEHEQAKGTNQESFKLGYLMGFHRVLTLMQQQAEGFEIEQQEIAMQDFDADVDLS